MSETIVPVQHSTLGTKAWKPYADYSFAANSIIAPISTEELSITANVYPLAFLSAEQPVMVAVIGLQQGKNLLVAPNGHWVGSYVPATFRAWPFKLIRAGEEQLVLGYDHSSGLLVEEGEGEAFFETNGEPTQRVKDMLQFLVGFNRGQQTATALAAKLRDARVLEPWPLTVEGDNGQKTEVQGLLRVNERALGALDDAAFLELRHSGSLTMAYAQLFSMANISILGRLAQAQAHYAQQSLNDHARTNAPIFAPKSGSETINWDLMLKGDKN